MGLGSNVFQNVHEPRGNMAVLGPLPLIHTYAPQLTLGSPTTPAGLLRNVLGPSRNQSAIHIVSMHGFTPPLKMVKALESLHDPVPTKDAKRNQNSLEECIVLHFAVSP